MKYQSVVLGSVAPETLHVSTFKEKGAQHFVKDEVLIKPALDPYLEILRAAKVMAEGRSLVLDSMMRSPA